MADERTGYKRSASDRKLDQSAEAANDGGQTSDTQHSTAAGHTAAGTAKDDTSSNGATSSDDSLESREQHDDAEKN